MPATVLRRTAGNSLPSYDGELQGQDITGYTIVMNIRRPDGTTFSRASSFTDAPNGKFEITFGSSDFLTPGDYPSEIKVIDLVSDDETFGDITIKAKAAII